MSEPNIEKWLKEFDKFWWHVEEIETENGEDREAYVNRQQLEIKTFLARAMKEYAVEQLKRVDVYDIPCGQDLFENRVIDCANSRNRFWRMIRDEVITENTL